MTMNKTKPLITAESIWREDDKRATRYVKVVGFIDPDGQQHRAEGFSEIALNASGKIAIIGCDVDGRPTGRVTYAAANRFGRSGGYRPVATAAV